MCINGGDGPMVAGRFMKQQKCVGKGRMDGWMEVVAMEFRDGPGGWECKVWM